MITVVSGLPRSGTSLMMQMLAAGGMPILQDEDRPPDAHNPRGYYEYRKVRALERDNSWLADAEGKALKVVSLLLYHLPADFDYRVIFLQRDLEEILNSQESMLSGLGRGPGPDRAHMRQHFERHLRSLEDWFPKQSRLRVLECRHSDLITAPEASARDVARFLDLDLNIPQMVQAVDPALYRQRAPKGQ